jgi:hypothetical protein
MAEDPAGTAKPGAVLPETDATQAKAAMDDDRYFPDPAELEILIPNLKEYFQHPKRSPGRKNQISRTLEQLNGIHPGHWTERNVRVWFTNNQKQYMGEDRGCTEWSKKVLPASGLGNLIPPEVLQYIQLQYGGAQSRPGSGAPSRASSEVMQQLSRTSSDIDEPLPELPDLSNWAAADPDSHAQKKLELQQLLKRFHRYIRGLQSLRPDERAAAQAVAERRFIALLRLFRDKLGIPLVESGDSACTRIRTFTTNEIRRAIERRVDAADSTELEAGCPFISYPKAWKLPRLSPDLQALYYGRYGDNGRSVTEYANLEVFDLHGDDFVCVCYDGLSSSHRLVSGDMDVQTGFFSHATSMTIDFSDRRVWIAGDLRVRSFILDSLHHDDTLYVRREVVTTSCLAIWHDFVVLGADGLLIAWRKDGPVVTHEWALREYQEYARAADLDLEAVDWNPGRAASPDFVFQNELGHVTAVCPVGPNLAVASSNYEAIHVFSLTAGGRITQRLIGHTMGITCLLSHADYLVSGSRDKTVRIWNMTKGVVEFSLERHDEAVSALEIAEYGGSLFLFTGGQDHIVHAWDLTRKRSMFQLDVGERLVPVGMYFDVGEKELQIVVLPLDQSDSNAVHRAGQVQGFRFLKCDNEKPQ